MLQEELFSEWQGNCKPNLTKFFRAEVCIKAEEYHSCSGKKSTLCPWLIFIDEKMKCIVIGNKLEHQRFMGSVFCFIFKQQKRIWKHYQQSSGMQSRLWRMPRLIIAAGTTSLLIAMKRQKFGSGMTISRGFGMHMIEQLKTLINLRLQHLKKNASRNSQENTMLL